MELTNYIDYAMNSLLKNQILEVLQEITIIKILKQSNFVKRDIGFPPFQIEMVKRYGYCDIHRRSYKLKALEPTLFLIS